MRAEEEMRKDNLARKGLGLPVNVVPPGGLKLVVILDSDQKCTEVMKWTTSPWFAGVTTYHVCSNNQEELAKRICTKLEGGANSFTLCIFHLCDNKPDGHAFRFAQKYNLPSLADPTSFIESFLLKNWYMSQPKRRSVLLESLEPPKLEIKIDVSHFWTTASFRNIWDLVIAHSKARASEILQDYPYLCEHVLTQIKNLNPQLAIDEWNKKMEALSNFCAHFPESEKPEHASIVRTILEKHILPALNCAGPNKFAYLTKEQRDYFGCRKILQMQCIGYLADNEPFDSKMLLAQRNEEIRRFQSVHLSRKQKVDVSQMWLDQHAVCEFGKFLKMAPDVDIALKAGWPIGDELSVFRDWEALGGLFFGSRVVHLHRKEDLKQTTFGQGYESRIVQLMEVGDPKFDTNLVHQICADLGIERWTAVIVPDDALLEMQYAAKFYKRGAVVTHLFFQSNPGLFEDSFYLEPNRPIPTPTIATPALPDIPAIPTPAIPTPTIPTPTTTPAIPTPPTPAIPIPPEMPIPAIPTPRETAIPIPEMTNTASQFQEISETSDTSTITIGMNQDTIIHGTITGMVQCVERIQHSQNSDIQAMLPPTLVDLIRRLHLELGNLLEMHH